MVMPPIKFRHGEVFSAVFSAQADVSLNSAEIVFRQGERADSALYLISGRVSIGIRLDDGRVVTVAVRGPGELIGEMALVTGIRCSEVQSIDPVLALRVSYALITQLVNCRPDFALAMHSLATARLYEANAMLASALAGD